jgi:hypothetical protein
MVFSDSLAGASICSATFLDEVVAEDTFCAVSADLLPPHESEKLNRASNRRIGDFMIGLHAVLGITALERARHSRLAWSVVASSAIRVEYSTDVCREQ